MAYTVTLENFKECVLLQEQLVLVDFWADWCGPCRTVSPLIDQLEEEYQEKVVFAKINVDEQQEISEQYRISSIPTILLVKNGIVVERLVGAHSLDEYRENMDKYLTE